MVADFILFVSTLVPQILYVGFGKGLSAHNIFSLVAGSDDVSLAVLLITQTCRKGKVSFPNQKEALAMKPKCHGGKTFKWKEQPLA